jgi:ATP-dependent protease ClpP protease subunit
MTAGADEPDNAELLIFAPIGDWEDMGDVSAKAFARDLAALPKSVKRLDIHINSPGGSLFEASAIYSRLADHPSNKIVYVDGLAASAASLVAMVGHKIYVRANATIMIHMPSGIVMGNADDMRHMAGALDTVTESMINVYSKRTKLPRDEIRTLLAAESWFDPDTAVEKGFADEVRGVVKAAALTGHNRAVFNGVEFDLSRFHKVPAFNATTPTERPNMNTNPSATGDPAPGSTTPPAPPTPPTPPAAPPPPAHQPTPPTPPAHQPTPPAHQPTPPAHQPGNETDLERGRREERERVTNLQKLSRPATAAIVEAAIKEGKQPSDIYEACITAMDKANKRTARMSDAAELDRIPPSDGSPGGDDNDFANVLRGKVAARRKMGNRSRQVMSHGNSRN